MNYLAHAYLSGSDEELLIGNFIADGIRGNKILVYPPGIQRGIQLHRFIDSYTDNYPGNTTARKILQPVAGKYAGVVLDIFYDHLLAINWPQYSSLKLEDYVVWCYEVVLRYENILPERTAFMFPYMRKGNWLLNYANKEGILRSMKGLSERIASRPSLVEAGELAFNEIDSLQEIFDPFFSALQEEIVKFPLR